MAGILELTKGETTMTTTNEIADKIAAEHARKKDRDGKADQNRHDAYQHRVDRRVEKQFKEFDGHDCG